MAAVINDQVAPTTLAGRPNKESILNGPLEGQDLPG